MAQRAAAREPPRLRGIGNHAVAVAGQGIEHHTTRSRRPAHRLERAKSAEDVAPEEGSLRIGAEEPGSGDRGGDGGDEAGAEVEAEERPTRRDATQAGEVRSELQ